MCRLALPLAIALLAGSTAVAAQEPLGDYPAGLRSSLSANDEGAVILRYADEVCWWECPVATFTCAPDQTVTIALGIPHDAVRRWFALPAASAVYPARARLSGDDPLADLILVSLAFSELDVNWTATLRPLTTASGWMSRFASAGQVSIDSPVFALALSPAEGDAENRAAFVEACLAM